MKNKSIFTPIIKVLLVSCWLFLFLPASVLAYEIWVSPRGNDAAVGSRTEPLKSLYMAQRKARELRRLNQPGIENGIFIMLKGGEYVLDEPLRFRPEDSGSQLSPTVFKAAEKELPVISGGVQIEGWKPLAESLEHLPSESRRNIWVADLPKVGGHRLLFRQLWVNNKKASRASNLDDGPLARIMSVDKENEIMWIPQPDFPLIATPNLELVILQWWAIANLRVKDIVISGDSVGLHFHQPESRVEFQHPWPAPFMDSENNLNGNSAFFFVNSPALLNAPGEWYADIDKGKIYYWPREGEDLQHASVVAPVLENLVSIEGTLDRPVEHLHFDGLSFQHTTWLRPSLQGHVPLQAGMYLLEAYNLDVKGTPDKPTLCNLAWTGRQPAGIVLQAARYIHIENCEVRHMASSTLQPLGCERVVPL
ncbi:MAG: hypothetical protein LC643_02725 [Bacteroidales bacterium]|nr:hypothetical protein [Bacteroidales bacterium]